MEIERKRYIMKEADKQKAFSGTAEFEERYEKFLGKLGDAGEQSGTGMQGWSPAS